MIVKMKKVYVLAPCERKVEMLNAIRELGVLHIVEKAPLNAQISETLSNVSKIYGLLKEKQETKQKSIIEGEAFTKLHNKIVSSLEEKNLLSEEIIKLRAERERISSWGDFNPSEILKLEEKGLKFSFYLLTKKEISLLPESITFIRLKGFDKKEAIAVVGETLDISYENSRFELPKAGLSEIDNKICEKQKRIEQIDAFILESSSYVSSYEKKIKDLTNELIFDCVSESSITESGLSIIVGFIPEDEIASFKDCAKKNAYAYALDDPSDEDLVPTKVRYNGLTKMMKPLFDMLGTVPGYKEYDISTYFLLFLSLFFAMIIGDAAYGLLFMILGVVMHIKAKKVSNLNMLLYVMSGATIIWGALTGTWFGSESAMKIGFLRALVIPQIANYPQYFGIEQVSSQNAVMKFCFAIGMIQLSLACLMNIVRKFKQRSLALVADFAWLVMIVSIYFLALMLVIGEEVNIFLIFALIIGGLFTVIIFGSQERGQSFSKGLKAGLGGAFTTFLNTISAFGNVMSYIRLFAVGMASLAIAQSFNGMAEPMLQGWAFPAGMLILIIGHVLNIVMGMLSVVVHGVRLNLLEFSGQLSMEWAGIPYEPFKKN